MVAACHPCRPFGATSLYIAWRQHQTLLQASHLCHAICHMLQVVAAPTGSGKTGVMELAILRVMSHFIDPTGAFKLNPGAAKIIYLAPIRALVQEKVKEWQAKFGAKLGLTCCEMTGDTDTSENLNFDTADVICTTPEKFGKLQSDVLPGCHTCVWPSQTHLCTCPRRSDK